MSAPRSFLFSLILFLIIYSDTCLAEVLEFSSAYKKFLAKDTKVDAIGVEIENAQVELKNASSLSHEIGGTYRAYNSTPPLTASILDYVERSNTLEASFSTNLKGLGMTVTAGTRSFGDKKYVFPGIGSEPVRAGSYFAQLGIRLWQGFGGRFQELDERIARLKIRFLKFSQQREKIARSQFFLNAYLASLAAQEKLVVAKSFLALLENDYSMITKLVRAGRISRLEQLRAEGQVQDLRLNVISLEKEMIRLSKKIAQLIGEASQSSLYSLKSINSQSLNDESVTRGKVEELTKFSAQLGSSEIRIHELELEKRKTHRKPTLDLVVENSWDTLIKADDNLGLRKSASALEAKLVFRMPLGGTPENLEHSLALNNIRAAELRARQYQNETHLIITDGTEISERIRAMQSELETQSQGIERLVKNLRALLEVSPNALNDILVASSRLAQNKIELVELKFQLIQMRSSVLFAGGNLTFLEAL